MTGSFGTASLLVFAVGVVLAPGVAVSGVALTVLVLRAILAQAVDRDAEARHFRAELDEVI